MADATPATFDATYHADGPILRRMALRNDGTVRLSTLLSSTGFFHRRLLRRGKALLNGDTVSLDMRYVPNETPDTLEFGGETFQVRRDDALVLAMHKPLDCVTAHEDPTRHDMDESPQTVFDLLPEWMSIEGLEPIGRLDKDTSGLLLFTEDGTLSQRLRHPSRAIERRYVATLARPLEASHVALTLTGGVTLRDGTMVKPKAVEQLDATGHRWALTITEGKYHEVRRFFAALGSHVDQLHRVGYSVVQLADGCPVAALDDAGGVPIVTRRGECGNTIIDSGVARILGPALSALLHDASLDRLTPVVEISLIHQEMDSSL